MVDQLFATILGFAEQSFSNIRSVDCLVKRPIAFDFTEPSISIVCLLILDLRSFNCSRPIVWPIAWLFAVLPNRCPCSVAQLLLAYCLTYCSIVLALYVWIVLDYWLLKLRGIQDKIYPSDTLRIRIQSSTLGLSAGMNRWTI